MLEKEDGGRLLDFRNSDKEIGGACVVVITEVVQCFSFVIKG